MRAVLRLYLAALVLLLCGSSPPPHPKTILAAVPISRMDQSWWRTRHEAKLEELARGPVNLIFLGDSITQDWEHEGGPDFLNFAPSWHHYYDGRNAVNLGFSGDTTANLLWRIENGEVAGISPKVAVILIGANNLGRLHWSAEDTVAGIAAIVEQLRQRLPHTKLLLLGILPSDRSAWATETTIAVNRALFAKYAHATDLLFLDIGQVFMRGGKLNRDLYADPKETPPRAPLHPSAEGQALMAAAIEPALAALLGDRPR
jgi:lysophospholipase L1-like esterase